MELHTKYGMFHVGKAHNLALVRPCGDLQALRQCAASYQQGMITCRLKRTRQSRKDVFTAMPDWRCFPMHEAIRSHDFTAVGMPDALLAKTNPKGGNARSEARDHITADSGLIRCARSWRNHNALRVHPLD